MLRASKLVKGRVFAPIRLLGLSPSGLGGSEEKSSIFASWVHERALGFLSEKLIHQ